MPLLPRITSLWNTLTRRSRLEHDLDDELRDYIERRTAQHVAAGVGRDAARRAALLEVGGVEQVKESVRDVRAGATLEQLRQDFAHGLRMLRRNAAFTVLAATTLALGIGANTAIFSIVDTVVFRPLPYKDPDRLVRIYVANTNTDVGDMSFADFEDVRRDTTVFERVAADDSSGVIIMHESGARELSGRAVLTSDWLATLGVQPILGRVLLPEESHPGRNTVAILSHAYWRRRFASDPQIIGKALTVDGSRVTIVGVLPANVLRYNADVFLPLVPAAKAAQGRGHRDVNVVARLKPGLTIAQAQTQVEVVARRLRRDFAATNADVSFRVAPLGKTYAGIDETADGVFLLLWGAVGFVLLIACANVSNLLVVRAVARHRECVIRSALGAGRARLVRQMVAETMPLFLIGGAAGFVLAYWSIDAIVGLAVSGNYLPERLAVPVNLRVFGFSLAVALAAGLIVGLVPAFHASQADPNEALRASGRTMTGGRQHRVTRLLVAGELALSVVLLVGFGLMIRSLVGVHAVSMGINPDRLLLTIPYDGPSGKTSGQFWTAVVDRVPGVPGVESAAICSRPPGFGAPRRQFAIEGTDVRDDARAFDVLVGGDYLRTMGIPILSGRPFAAHDGANAPPVAVVSESFARRYFAGANAIGRRIRVDERRDADEPRAMSTWREIVGVVADVRQADLVNPLGNAIYRPFTQVPARDMFLLVRARTAPDADRLAAELRTHLRHVDATAEWLDVRHMRDVVANIDAIRLRRFVVILLGNFAALALLLAAVGTYGVMAYSVAQRTREIGVRVALGASRPVVFRQILGETAVLTAAGIVVGAVAASGLTRFIGSLLFGVSRTDLLTYGTVSTLLAAIALLASYAPARRATRVDPVTALRTE